MHECAADVGQVTAPAGGRRRTQTAPAAPAGAVPPGGGPLPDFRQEGVGLQQLVRERRGGLDRPRALQLGGGDTGKSLARTAIKCVVQHV